MKVLIFQFILAFAFLTIASTLPAASDVLKSTDFQSKRDLSLSYAATDIGSKDGSRAKTITVIKNVAGKKDAPIKVDPTLHKSENWGSQFRDNFDSYGVIPDVPDIDELFDFVNKKKEKKPVEKNEPPKKEPEGEDENNSDEGKEEPEKTDEEKTTSSPAPVDEAANESKDGKVEKIAGDAELIQPPGKQGKVKSQSLDLGKYSVRETSFDDNYSTVQDSFRHFSKTGNKNEKYIQQSAVPYNYPDPNVKGYFPVNRFSPQTQVGRGSIAVTTPSGRSFDIPLENSTANPPYLAPNFRRNQNLLPGQQFPTSSQSPYVAPNLRKTYEVQLNNTNSVVSSNCAPNATSSRQPASTNVYKNVPTNIRTDSISGYKPNISRSRGLRY